MPGNFFTIAWPLAFSIIILAGLILILAALTTFVAAITRARQLGKEKSTQAPEEEDEVDGDNHLYSRTSEHTGNWIYSEPGVLETITSDGVHYIPIP